MVTAIAHTMYVWKKFITLVWQVDNVLIEAGSLIQAGAEVTSSDRSRLLLEVLWYMSE